MLRAVHVRVALLLIVGSVIYLWLKYSTTSSSIRHIPTKSTTQIQSHSPRNSSREKYPPKKKNSGPILSSNVSKPLHHSPNRLKKLPIHLYMKHLSKQKKCRNKPIIISMAKVISPLYWQLIENFYATMIRFDLFECSMMVCISDFQCLEACKKNNYPWYTRNCPYNLDNITFLVTTTNIQ